MINSMKELIMAEKIISSNYLRGVYYTELVSIVVYVWDKYNLKFGLLSFYYTLLMREWRTKNIIYKL